MRKIPSDIESPIDNLVLKFAEGTGLMDLFYRLGFTPNILTTIGNIFRASSIYFFISGNGLLFFITAFLGFMFDCFDGHFARQFNMTSNFGDYYDHISDLVYHLIYIYL